MVIDFASFLDHVSTSHADQPQDPTGGKPCEWVCDAPVSVGWAWTGRSWAAACPGHMQVQGCNRIFNTEYLGDDE